MTYHYYLAFRQFNELHKKKHRRVGDHFLCKLDGWLCVAKLPLDYSDDEFVNLAGAYGKVREAFLMISEKTGKYFS